MNAIWASRENASECDVLARREELPRHLFVLISLYYDVLARREELPRHLVVLFSLYYDVFARRAATSSVRLVFPVL